jgi:hypothetical protein
MLPLSPFRIDVPHNRFRIHCLRFGSARAKGATWGCGSVTIRATQDFHLAFAPIDVFHCKSRFATWTRHSSATLHLQWLRRRS